MKATWAVLSCGTVYYAIQGGSNQFWVCGRNPKVWPFKWKLPEQYFPVVLFILLYKAVLSFESVEEILKCDHSNESYWAVLSCGTVYYAAQGGSNQFWVCGRNPKVWPFKWKLLSSTFLWCCLLYCTRRYLFWVCGWNPKVWPFKWKLLSSTFLWCSLLYCTRRY